MAPPAEETHGPAPPPHSEATFLPDDGTAARLCLTSQAGHLAPGQTEPRGVESGPRALGAKAGKTLSPAGFREVVTQQTWGMDGGRRGQEENISSSQHPRGPWLL